MRTPGLCMALETSLPPVRASLPVWSVSINRSLGVGPQGLKKVQAWSLGPFGGWIGVFAH